jgi:gliding motility-associated-like protein
MGQSGCTTTAPVTVTVNPLPSATVSGGGIVCSGSSVAMQVTFTGKPPYSFTYTDGTRNYTINSISRSPYMLFVNPTANTTYTITSVTSGNCTNTSNNSSANISVIPVEKAVRYPTVTAAANYPIQLQARTLGVDYTYNWSPATGLSYTTINNPVFTHDKDMLYYITLTSPAGCKIVDTLQVRMSLESDLFVAKAWSPNTDGHNDKLYPLTRNISEIKYFRIFNRWGQLMFETNKLGDGWDGIFNGKPQISDVYTWTVEAIGVDGKHYKRSGNSVLLR